MNNKDGFILYKSFYKPISRLSDKQLGRLFRAIYRYQIDGEATVEEDIEMAFEFFKNQFEIDESKYQGIVERNRSNGRKGVEAKNAKQASGCDRYPNKPVGAKQASGSYKEKDKDKDKENENAVISPLPPQGDAAATAAAKLKRDVEFQKTQTMWKEGICMKFHIDGLRVNGYLDEFYTDMLCRGYHVTNLPSLFTSWLSDKLNQQEKQARNETAKTLKDDRFPERRGTEPASEDRKGFKGTFQH